MSPCITRQVEKCAKKGESGWSALQKHVKGNGKAQPDQRDGEDGLDKLSNHDNHDAHEDSHWQIRINLSSHFCSSARQDKTTCLCTSRRLISCETIPPCCCS